MRGIILAGGNGTRLLPLTEKTNKHLLPVKGKPIILYSIEKMIEANILDIMIVVSPEYINQFASLLGSGEKYGCNITFSVQEKPLGIVHALKQVMNYCIDAKEIVLLLGDNLFSNSLNKLIDEYKSSRVAWGVVALKKVNNPQDFGVATLLNNGFIGCIEEKPKFPKSNLAVTGIYIYNSFSIHRLINNIMPSKRGEEEISDLNNMIASRGYLSHIELDGFWIDAGTHENLQIAENTKW